MSEINCLKCENWRGGHLECKHGFRMAADGGGRSVDCKENVWFCQDYEEREENENEYDG